MPKHRRPIPSKEKKDAPEDKGAPSKELKASSIIKPKSFNLSKYMEILAPGDFRGKEGKDRERLAKIGFCMWSTADPESRQPQTLEAAAEILDMALHTLRRWRNEMENDGTFAKVILERIKGHQSLAIYGTVILGEMEKGTVTACVNFLSFVKWADKNSKPVEEEEEDDDYWKDAAKEAETVVPFPRVAKG